MTIKKRQKPMQVVQQQSRLIREIFATLATVSYFLPGLWDKARLCPLYMKSSQTCTTRRIFHINTGTDISLCSILGGTHQRTQRVHSRTTFSEAVAKGNHGTIDHLLGNEI